MINIRKLYIYVYKYIFQRYIRQPENPEHQEFFDFISSMLMYDPTERISLHEAFRQPFFSPYFRTDQATGNDNGERDRSHSTSR